jgi:hypothetical protein
VNRDTYEALQTAYLLRASPKPRGTTDFEKLNNAIVLMGQKLPANKDAQALVNAWSEYASSGFWRTVNDLVLGQQLRSYWEQYTDVLTGNGPNKVKISTEERSRVPTPASVKPGSTWTTFKDLWTPMLEQARAAGAAIVAAQKQKLKDLLREAGQEFGKGTAEAAGSGAEQKVLVWGGLALLGAGVWYALQQKRGAQ